MKPTSVVSNTSPLIFLEKIDALNLLDDCFVHVYIPEQVKAEWGKDAIPDFIKVHPVSEFGKSFVKGAMGRLHQGELCIIGSQVTNWV
jgi:predicted nucleic acid-binding protein